MRRLIYKIFLKPFFFLFNPELVHDFFILAGELLGRSRLGQSLVNTLFGQRKKIVTVVDGIEYKSRVILSAGFDTDGRLIKTLPFVGFGGEEIGSITARVCKGNDTPRLTRLKKTKSIQVYKGLRNRGVEELIKKIKKTKVEENFVLGISIARTNNNENSNPESSIDDYFYSYRRLVETGVGDYYTINISCPNAFSGEFFLEPKNLDKLLEKLSEIKNHKPVYIKMPINKDWKGFKQLLEVAKQFKIVKGVVVGNLDKSYRGCARGERPKQWRGGLSGVPCRELSNELIKNIKMTYRDRFTIIGAGGVFTPEDALKKMELGADLIQLITGMIFEGPQLINDINNAVDKKYR